MADIEKRVIAPAARAAVILFIVRVSGMWGSPALNGDTRASLQNRDRTLFPVVHDLLLILDAALVTLSRASKLRHSHKSSAAAADRSCKPPSPRPSPANGGRGGRKAARAALFFPLAPGTGERVGVRGSRRWHIGGSNSSNAIRDSRS